MLFAGCDNFDRGQVIQYDLTTGQVVKNYSQASVNFIRSSIRVGTLWLFGGFKLFNFSVIDSVTRQVMQEPAKPVTEDIYSLTVGSVHRNDRDPKLLLFIVGMDLSNSKPRTDVFDITDLVKQFSVSPGK